MEATAHEPTAPHYSTIEVDREARIVPGSRLQGGRLEVVAELARGGMSVVYQALDHGHGGRHVALKIVTAEAAGSATAARFRNEARLGASLDGHPHVVRALSFGCLDGPKGFEGRMYLLTELVEGRSLDCVMGDHRLGLDWRRACSIARDVARALVDLHERGIVHRDIKPGNVLLASGPDERAMLIDFGLAYATGDGWEEQSPDLTRDGHAPGTVLYMSPQQAAHQRPAPSMDAYSFGVMLYELFSGNPPHHKLGVGELLARKCDRNRPPFPIAKMCPELDSRLAGLIDRCLLFDPNARPRAAELVEVLDDVLEAPPAGEPRAEEVAASVPIAARVSAPPTTSSSRRRWVVGAAGALAVGVAGVWIVTGDPVGPTTAMADDRVTAPTVALGAHAEADRGVHSDAVASPPQKERASIPAPNDDHDAVLPPAVPVARPQRVEAPAVAQGDPQPPRAPAKAARKPSQPPAPSPTPPADHCPEQLQGARDAADARQWGRVLRLTRSPACWTPHASKVRTMLRTQALFETLRFAECAEAGRGSTEPDVIRWARICENKSHEEIQ